MVACVSGRFVSLHCTAEISFCIAQCVPCFKLVSHCKALRLAHLFTYEVFQCKNYIHAAQRIAKDPFSPSAALPVEMQHTPGSRKSLGAVGNLACTCSRKSMATVTHQRREVDAPSTTIVACCRPACPAVNLISNACLTHFT